MKFSPDSPSLDDDLFPKKEPRRGGFWKWVVIIGCALFFVYRSTLPAVHLKSAPPPEFNAGNSRRGHRLTSSEKQIAQAYWNAAVHSIQWAYPRGKSLPYTPPPDFRVKKQFRQQSSNIDLSRDFYWRRLRAVWRRPDIWHISYGWNTHWLIRWLVAAPSLAGQVLQQFAQTVRYWWQELGNTSFS